MSWNTRILGGLALATSIGSATAQFAPVDPSTYMQLAPSELGPLDQGQVNGLPALHPGNHPFRMASAVKVQAYDKGNAQRVVRSAGGNAAAYKAVPSLAAPLLPEWPSQASLHKFPDIGDNAQAWATMTSGGVPYLYLTAYGQADSESTASWSTTVTVPAGSVSPKVVLRFVIPAASVSGNTEQEGPARWRSHLRAELLVNGYPAWSTEAMRLAVDPYGPVSNYRLLQTFGASWPFPDNDDDSDPNNNSGAGSTGPAAKRVVYLSLGRFAPGAVLDLSMILRGVALTLGKSDTGNGNRCQPNKMDDTLAVCSNAVVTVRGDPADGPKIYLVP